MEQTSSGMGRSRTKKKGTLTKLKERKDREFGSTSSLRKDHSDENCDELISDYKNEIPLDANEKPSNAPLNVNGSSKPDLYHFSTKDSCPMPDSSDTHHYDSVRPRPKPRSTQKLAPTSSDSSSQKDDTLENPSRHNSKNKETILASNDSANEAHDTSQRRKNFKAKDKSESLDSITSGGFTPKPPVTPRSARSNPRTPRGYVPFGKGETNSKEKDESQNSVDVEKNKGAIEERSRLEENIFDISDLVLDEMESKFEQIKIASNIEAESLPKEKKKLLARRGSINNGSDTNNSHNSNTTSTTERTSENKASHHKFNNIGSPVLSASSLRDESPQRSPFLKSRRRSGSYSPSRALPDKFKPPASPGSSHFSGENNGMGSNSNHSDSHHPYRPKASSFSSSIAPQSGPISTQVLFTSNENSRSVTTPPSSARLDPVSPRSQPPPLPNDFSSHSLRTAYKIDPNIRPNTSSGLQRLDGDKSDSGTASGTDKVSQKSFSSGSVLPTITTKEARSRSFVEGSVSSATPSMLGSEELERYFPDRKVNVLVGTWNMNELKEVSIPLDDFILPERCDYVQDIYAIGTQENYVNKKEWEVKLQETLGPSHVMFHSVTLGALHLVIFVRRDLIWFCSLPEDNAITLRAVTMVKTKGAIGISFTLFGSSFLFINCHLTSDRDNVNSRKKHRLGDYFKVIQDMNFKLIQEVKQAKSSNATKKRVDVTALYDGVFWCGDLNFRIERQRHAVEGKVNQITSEEIQNFETLLGGDQLLKFVMEGKIFNGFQEGRINFHPTFKFDVRKDTYDSSVKNRVPSYTDRIMFRSKKKNDITCLHYDAVMELKISDHRPVFGQFEAGIKPGRDNMVFGAGHFDRTVYMEANQRRAANQSTTQKKPRPSSICSVQ